MIGTYLGMSQDRGPQGVPQALFLTVHNKALEHPHFETFLFTKSEKSLVTQYKKKLLELNVAKRNLHWISGI